MKVAILPSDCIFETTMLKNLLENFKENGIERVYTLKEADYILAITCCSTGMMINEYANYFYDLVDLMKNELKDLKLIVCGCYPRAFNVEGFLKDNLDENSYKVIYDVDFPIPVINYIKETNKRTTKKAYFKNRTLFVYNSNIRVQFFLTKGCINKCSFCKTNYNNEKLVSTPYQETLEYLTNLIESGTQEIILSGENTTLYGIDEFGYPILHLLIHGLSQVRGIKRIELFEITPNNMYPELYDEIINNPIVDIVCMQAESFSNRILNLMNRGYDMETYDDIVVGLKNAGKNIRTVLMSGFPTEEYADLDMTIDYITKRDIICEVICEYSDYKNIPSSKLPQFGKREKRKHTLYLMEKVKKNNLRIYEENIVTDIPLRLISKKDGYAIFSTNIGIKAISRKKCYQDLELGSHFEAIPSGIIKKSLMCNSSAYKL